MEQGIFSECREGTDLNALAIVQAAWKGLNPDRVWDVHAHLFGNGPQRPGHLGRPDFDKPFWPAARVRHAFFSNAGCVGSDDNQLDQGMVKRINRLVDDFPAGAKVMLLAFDFTYDERGKQLKEHTTFSVPNKYRAEDRRARPDRFEWIASIHPARDGCRRRARVGQEAGARAVKWLPPTMNIDLRAPSSVAFYDHLARLDMPLLVHLGRSRQ
jgi:mannonate dehydratase